jgi:hypothetical protein
MEEVNGHQHWEWASQESAPSPSQIWRKLKFKKEGNTANINIKN